MPPISACFILGILWPRLNGSGAITSLLAGFVMGATRFIMELKDRASGVPYFTSSTARWLIDMNFLHYAILMFVLCSAVLIIVSLMTPAPDRRKLAGLTFATVADKIDLPTATVVPFKPKPFSETQLEHRLNLGFTFLLIATVIGLWIYFR